MIYPEPVLLCYATGMYQLELWLVRHGETDWNKEARIQGFSDIPLNPYGLRQAEALKTRIGHEVFDYVYSSDLSRARQTAMTCYPEIEPVLDERLREINLGQLEGRIRHELSAEEQQQLNWRVAPFERKIPQGESHYDLHQRVSSWLNSLPESGRVIAFSHGGTISAILHSFTGRSASGDWGFRLKNTSISKVVITEGFTLMDTVNDAVHLEILGL